MKRKFVVGILSLACLTSLVVFGSTSEFVGILAESMPSIPITRIFTVSPEQPLRHELEKKTAVEGSVEEIPETVIWQSVFRRVREINIEAGKADQRGEDGDLYRNYFIRQGDLSIEHNAVLKEISSAYLNEIELLDQKAQNIADEAREKKGAKLSEPPKEFLEIKRQKDDLTLHYRDQFKNAIGAEAFANFSEFLRGDFSTGMKKVEIDNPENGMPLTNYLNITLYYDLNGPTVSGMTEVILDAETGFYYHPKAKSWLDNATTGQNMHFAQNQGYRWTTPARAWNATFTAIRGWTYCVYGEMWIVDVNFLSGNLAEHYVTSHQGCYTFPLPPTPTPTPTPFPTPTPCEPLNGLPCQTPMPTPTPTPSPSPSPEIQSVGFTGDFPIKRFADDSPILDPTWTKGGSNNAQNYVAYEKGTETTLMRLQASIQLTPAPPSGTMSARVRVKYSGSVIAAQTASQPITGNTINVDNLALSCPDGTPNPCRLEPTPKVKKGTYDFDWEVSFDDGNTWKPAGRSQHVIFWTYGAVAAEPPNCGTDTIRRNCLFVNEWGDRDWPGLYDKALEKAISDPDAHLQCGAPIDAQTPDQIAKYLACNIDHQIIYNTGTLAGDIVHPLRAYTISAGVQCSVNANLLRGLLRSIGINNSETVYVWGGKPNNTDRREDETGGSTYWYKIQNTSSSTGVVTEGHVTFQAIRPASNEGSISVQKDPHFNFHAMVKVFDVPTPTPLPTPTPTPTTTPSPSPTPNSNLTARYYDPSYAKRLEANPSRYPDYPYINNDLKFKLAVNLDDPNPRRHRYVDDDATKPYIVRALRRNLCVAYGSPPPCSDPNSKVKSGARSYMVAALPRTSVFDAQGVSTFSVWRPSDGTWYTYNAYDDSYSYGSFGMSGDKPIPADYDGDGFTDYAVFRPSNSTVYIWESDTQTLRTFVWNPGPTDKPLYGDFDGDGKSDIAFYRQGSPESQWYITRSSDGVTYSSTLGAISGVPVSGDFDGDGKTDIAVYRQDNWGTWTWLSSATGWIEGMETGGGPADIPVPGDYDGDGKTDFALYRPSDHYWQILYSGNDIGSYFYLGVAGDIPVPGDYDGDGKTDAALWSPSNGRWLVRNSSDATTTEAYWGGQFGDIPVGAVYIYY